MELTPYRSAKQKYNSAGGLKSTPITPVSTGSNASNVIRTGSASSKRNRQTKSRERYKNIIVAQQSAPDNDDEIDQYLDTVKCLQYMGAIKKNEIERSKRLKPTLPPFTESNDVLKYAETKDFIKNPALNTLDRNVRQKLSSKTSISTFSAITNDPAIISSALLREVFMVLVGVQAVYIAANIMASCDAAAVIAGSVAIQAIICHLDARPTSYWVSALLSINAAVALVISLFLRINGLEKLQLDPILKRMTVFYASTAVLFACLCCYLATTFARLISLEKERIQKSLDSIKIKEETV